MEIKRHYFEVMDIVDRLFVAMFDSLNQNCKKDLEAVGKQYPFEPLKYLRQTLRLTYEEGIQMLKDRSSRKMIGAGRKSQGLYRLSTTSNVFAVTKLPNVIHACLGHLSISKLQMMVSNLSKLSFLECESC